MNGYRYTIVYSPCYVGGPYVLVETMDGAPSCAVGAFETEAAAAAAKLSCECAIRSTLNGGAQ